eukprot:scaffold303714_cov33-Tisochrysis_lutea.AAC.2
MDAIAGCTSRSAAGGINHSPPSRCAAFGGCQVQPAERSASRVASELLALSCPVNEAAPSPTSDPLLNTPVSPRSAASLSGGARPLTDLLRRLTRE